MAFTDIVLSYQIRAESLDENTRMARNWTLEGSLNYADWTVIDTQTNQVGWVAVMTRTYNTPANATAYRRSGGGYR